MTQSPSPGWTPEHHRAAEPRPWMVSERGGFAPTGEFRYPAPDAAAGADQPARPAPTGPAGYGPAFDSSPRQAPMQPAERTAPWQSTGEPVSPSDTAQWFTRAESPTWPAEQARPAGPQFDANVPAGPRQGAATGLSALIRGQAVDRMRRANRNHVRAGLENLGTARACGPYCLTLLSVERRGFARISLASRLDDDDPDHYNLTDLLTDVLAEANAKRAEARRAGRSWDPRTPLDGIVLRSDEFDEQTELIGVGVSLLDLPDLPWAEAKRSWEKTWQGDRAMASTKLGGQTKLWLADGTAIHTVRHEDGPDDIRTTATIDIARPARMDPDLVTRATAQGDLSWERLRKLLDVLLES